MILILTISTARAFDVFVEPSLGFHTGSFKDQNSDLGVSGIGISGKTGLVFNQMVMGGVDLQFASYLLDNASEDKWENRSYGLFGGVDMTGQLPFKFWLTYFPYEELNHKTNGELFGNGYKFGLGYYPDFLEILGFVFEFKSSSYDKIEDSSGERDLVISTEITSLFFGVSFFFKDQL